ncbi:MAG: hypothetical protein ACLQO1_24885 [Steroidobacteraceae bacterium]
MRGETPLLRPERAARLAALALACGFAPLPGRADPGDIHGRFEVQDAGLFAPGDSLYAAVGARDGNDLLSNLRLTWEPTLDRWRFQLHDLITVEDGTNVRVERAEADLLAAPPATWFNLTQTFTDHGQILGTQRIDRLAVTYTTPDFVLRAGRQALTWGSGLVFRPMDLFDPFSPTATDTEYKPGTDMVYTQWLYGDGSDLQFIVVPRPDRAGELPSSDGSSAAMHLHTVLFGHQTTWLLARDHGDWVGAIGVNGALAGATWNVELVPTIINGGTTRISALGNVSDAITVVGRNATVFLEYFHNGFGVGSGIFTLASLPPDLVDRLARGQLFDTRRNYLAAGLTLEVNPLLNVSPTLIVDLDDRSLFTLVAATYSLSDNLNLIGGAQFPVGAAGTEFGGIPLAPGNQTRLAPATQIYLQIRKYF